MSSVDGSDVELVAPPAVGAKRGRRVGRRVARASGGFVVFAIFASSSGDAFWQNVFDHDNTAGYIQAGRANNFLGLALAQCTLDPVPITDTCPHFQRLRAASLKGRRKFHQLVGFANWRIFELLSNWYETAQPPLILPHLAWLREQNAKLVDGGGHVVGDPTLTFGHYLDEWSRKYNFNIVTTPPILLDPHFVAHIYSEGVRILHTIPLFRNRRLFQRRFISGIPSPLMVKRWIQSQPVATGNAADVGNVCSKWFNSIDVHKVISWIRAGRFIKHITQIGAARTAFQELENTLQNDLTAGFRAYGPPYSAEAIRRARVTLDVTCMNIFRHFWRSLDADTVWIFIHIDASPQWKGLELFSGSFDLMVKAASYFCQHRYFPQVRIGPALFSVRGKCFALLWMIWLMVGPSYKTVKSFCRRVRYINSDYGSEHKIVDLPDLLIDFFRAIHVDVPRNALPDQYLFPHGLLLPGWHHTFDGIIRWGLMTLEFFGFFLQALKAWLKLCRNHMDDLAKMLHEDGLDAAVVVLRGTTFETFAQWRWRKIASCTRGVRCAREILLGAPCIATLRRFLATMHDTSIAKVILKSISSKVFPLHFQFVDWYAFEFCTMESWGSSCPKHQAEWLAKNPCKCNERGRLVALAHDWAVQKFTEIRAVADAWTPEEWGGMALYTQLRGCVMATIQRGLVKLAPFDTIPLLIAKIGFVAGARERCIHQYNTFKNHSRVSHEFLRVGYRLRTAIDDMKDDYDLSDDDLASGIQSLRDGKLDDSVNETPHSHFSRIHNHSPNSTFAWKAATLRLDQDLEDAEDLPSLTSHKDLQFYWDNFKMVLQTKGRKRNPKISRDKFIQRVYTLSDAFGACARGHERNLLVAAYNHYNYSIISVTILLLLLLL
jgi:hypothetical protein